MQNGLRKRVNDMEALKELAEKYSQRDDLYTENGEYTKTTVINAFNDGAKAMLQVIGFSLAAHRHKEIKVTTKKEREWLIKQINKTNMKVKELRVGNIVEVNHYEYGDMFASVTSINDAGDLCLHLLDERFTKEEYECTMNEVCPIPITDELLMECGLLKSHYSEKIFKIEGERCELIYYVEGKVLDIRSDTDRVSITCKYLHQLQNAYYLVTGDELEIKL